MRFIKEAVADYIESLNISEDEARLINLASHDLYFGPVYLDENNEVVSYLDEGAKPFNFSEACEKIRDILADVEDIIVYAWSGSWEFARRAEENEDCYLVERRDIIEEIVGTALLGYVL